MQKVKLISPITKQGVKKSRVCAYCRVSTNSADQLNSYSAQIRVYTKMIKEHSEWELIEIFADEGISGMKADNREEFQRMIRMCQLKQIDLILTKSVSRFARNVKEALSYVRELKLLGIGVQFEKEGINTLSMGDEMLLNTFSAIAQEESKAISQNQRLSIVKRMESGGAGFGTGAGIFFAGLTAGAVSSTAAVISTISRLRKPKSPLSLYFLLWRMTAFGPSSAFIAAMASFIEPALKTLICI